MRNKLLGLFAVLIAGVFLYTGLATDSVEAIKAIEKYEPKVRLTSMCYEGEGVGLMRFREENGGDFNIVWEDNDGNNGEFAAGETVFFDVTSPKTIVVKWYVKENPEIDGQTVKAQNTKECTYVTVCYEGETVEVIEDKGIPEGATRGECVEPTPTPTAQPTPEPRTTTQASAPVCPNGVPLAVPANPHVVRNGSTATVNAHIPEGDRANIYYRENSSSEWNHALRDVPVTNGYLSVDINDLDASLGYTFGIQAANGCAGGETILAVIVDPPASGVTFPLSYWEWLR